MRGDAVAFIAALLTLKAPVLTLPMVSLVIGSLSSSTLKIKHSMIIILQFGVKYYLLLATAFNAPALIVNIIPLPGL